ncbi:hypothetical protein F4679DRAFT_597129 [Xylaria curta]|nr:hypothetical protein F4679DRAFT_597129 [Xylaria curta]
MTSGPTADEEYSTLRQLIQKNLVRSEFEYNGGKKFLPIQSFLSLLTRDNIENDLPGASDELVAFVHEKATKIFATVLMTLVGHPKSTITSVMESFKKHGLDDSYLPLEEELEQQLASCPTDCKGHATALNVFHDAQLKACIYSLLTHQWMFLVPQFPLAKELRTLHLDCILPFTEVKRDSKRGEVVQAKLRVDHQKLIPRNHDNESSDVYVAVQRLNAIERTLMMSDPNSAWSREPNSMGEFAFSRLSHTVAPKPNSMGGFAISHFSHTVTPKLDSMEGFAVTRFSRAHFTPVIGSFSTHGNHYIITPWPGRPS